MTEVPKQSSVPPGVFIANGWDAPPEWGLDDRPIKELRRRIDDRAAIVDAARRGDITTDEAEEMAAEKGLDQLASEPDPRRFDPAAMARWPMVCAAVWIACRSFDEVRKYLPEYRENCIDWEPCDYRDPVDGGRSWQEYHGNHLVKRSPCNLFVLSLDEVLGRHGVPVLYGQRITIAQAKLELMNHLGAGGLQAVAIRDGVGLPELVAPHEWPYLQLSTRDDQDVAVYWKRLSSTFWSDITLSRAEAMKFWPPVAALPAGPATKEKVDSLYDRAIEIISASLDRSTMSATEFCAMAKQDFRIGSAKAKMVRSSAIEKLGATAWSKPGPKTKQRLG